MSVYRRVGNRAGGIIAGVVLGLVSTVSAGCSSIADHEERVFALASQAVSERIAERNVGHRLIENTLSERALMTEESVHIRQVLIMHDRSAGRPEGLNRTHSEAFALAAKVRDQLADGADFSEIARTYSDCPMGRYKGGDIGLIRRAETTPVFEEAVFSLKDKQLSAIVETDFGFHIIERIPHV